MPDVALVYGDEKKGAAVRLREAIIAAGYSVGTDETHAPDAPAEGELPDKIGAAAAIVVIWSRAAVDSELVGTIADEARQQGKLIEVSTDGIMPAESARAGRAALISGWRGEPHHPGWRAIAGRLQQLCGKPRAPDRAILGRAPDEPGSEAAAEPPRLRRPKGLALLGITVVGIAAWLRGRDN